MLGDLQEGLRQLWKAPGITTTAVIALALGIGAATATFTLVHQVMLKSLPVAKPEELWKIGDKNRCCNWGGYTRATMPIFRCSRGRHTSTFARTRRISRISRRCRLAMRR